MLYDVGLPKLSCPFSLACPNISTVQLVSKVRSQYAGHHQVKHLCGSVNVNAGKYWIELQYPEGPPKEYSRSGFV